MRRGRRTSWGHTYSHPSVSSPRPLVKTIVEMHMESEVQATIGVETVKGQSRLVLRDCGSSQGSLRISLLKR